MLMPHTATTFDQLSSFCVSGTMAKQLQLAYLAVFLGSSMEELQPSRRPRSKWLLHGVDARVTVNLQLCAQQLPQVSAVLQG